MNNTPMGCLVWIAAMLLSGCGWADGANAELKYSSQDMTDITEEEVRAAQQAWGNSIGDIGRVEVAGGDFEARAGAFVDSLYALDFTDVLFKPTMAERIPFRTTRSGIVSYFVANAPAAFPEDVAHGGFARKPWRGVRFEVAGNWLGPGAALSMGHYIFTDMNDTEHIAEFSMAYVRDISKRLRIALHHSSFPFCGEEFVSSRSCNLPRAQLDAHSVLRSALPEEHKRRLQAVGVTSNVVLNSEQTWGAGIIDLGNASAAEMHGQAVDFVEHSYAYSSTTPYHAPTPWIAPGCLFKPTKARLRPFRTSLAGAVSYFVGHDATFAEDHGFALQPWIEVGFEPAGITQLTPLLTVTMGHYFFTATDNTKHKAEFSLAFVPDAGNLVIALHHSSFPCCSTCGSALQADAVADASVSWAVATIFGGLSLSLLIISIRMNYSKHRMSGSEPLLHADVGHIAS
mmetsp:Transcript_38258/g.75859  ORF Transcript_38258/g.75859 Transcript_38258/m.75859 type:complete len:457 (+) Transcript_38258:41-1411(+)